MVGAFSDHTIPKYIERINTFCAHYLSNLKNIYFENGTLLKVIETCAFDHSPIEEITLPDTPLRLEGSPFYGTSISSLMFPKSLEAVDDSVFDGMGSLQKVDIAEGCIAAKIDSEKIIYNKTNSAILFIPESASRLNITINITSVNFELLRRPSFINLSVENGHSKFFAHENVLYSKDNKTLYTNAGANEVVAVLEECEEIHVNAFSGTALRKIEFLGSNLKYINMKAFYQVNVETFVFNEGLLKCMNNVFTEAVVKEVYFPSTLQLLDEVCFYHSTIETVNLSTCSKLTLGNRIFEGCSRLSNVILPDELETISSETFKNSAINEIVLPLMLTKLSNSAFYQSKIQTIYFKGNCLSKIDERCFAYCYQLKSLALPDSIKEFSTEAFSYCDNLVNLTFGEGSMLRTIGKGLIKKSNKINTIFLGQFVESIPECGLSESYGLKRIIVSQQNSAIVGIDGVVYTTDGKTLVACAGGKDSINIPSSVEIINGSAFFNCRLLEDVVFSLGSMVREIGAQTFYGCSNLTSIKFPTHLDRILSEAFKDCTSLESIVFEGHCEVRELGDSVFEGCSSLESITLPNGVRSIGSNCFSGCKSLRYAILSRGIQKVGSLCFRGDALLERVEFCSEEKPSDFDDTAFVDCEKLDWVYVSNSFSSQTQYIGGVRVLRIIDNDCKLPTHFFTNPECMKIVEGVFFSVISAPNESY